LSDKIIVARNKVEELVMGYVKTMDAKIVKIKNETNMDSFSRMISNKADLIETT